MFLKTLIVFETINVCCLTIDNKYYFLNNVISNDHNNNYVRKIDEIELFCHLQVLLYIIKVGY